MNFVDEIIDHQTDWAKVAIIQNDRNLTYEELKVYSYKIASTLVKSKINANDKVLVFLDKSIESIISFFGIMKCGAAFVPIDCSLPVSRIEYIISNCNPKCVITNSDKISQINDCIQKYNLETIIIDNYTDLNGSCNESDYENRKTKGDLAYIIYTSGSTGNPKGVMIRQDSFRSFVGSIVKVIPYYTKEVRYLSLFPFHFDASLCDIYPTLMVGGTLVLMDKFIMPNQLLDALVKYEITIVCMASTIVKLLVSRYSNIRNYKLPNLKAIWYGTESCPAKTVRELKEFLPEVKFIHSYGPTETTCTSHVYFCEDGFQDEDGVFPIGKPLPTIESYVFNGEGKPINPGEIGELYIGGIQVMAGYCNDKAKTNNVLVPHIYARDQILYKTGDYVTVDKDGNYIFINRKDDMVKSCGKLIYISEIEKVLLSHSKIEDIIIIPYEDELLITKLRAFVIVKEHKSLTKNEITNYVLTKLPAYMVPHDFVFTTIEEIPCNSSGKIDKKALLANYNKLRGAI